MEKTEDTEGTPLDPEGESIVAEVLDTTINAAFESGFDDAERGRLYRRLSQEFAAYADVMPA